jgi:hypothetical protein
MTAEQSFKYEVALSFAGEQRGYVERVARSLKGFGVSCFFDTDEAVLLWGTDGIVSLDGIYGTDARYVVMFVSHEYVAKPWCKVERCAALASRLERNDDTVLQVVFDRVKVPGMPPSEIYVEAKNFEPEQLALLICKKLGVDLSTQKASVVAPPFSPEDAKTVRFGYGSYGGRHTIGSGDWSFELHFSRAGSESIHIYNDTPTVRGLAFAPDAWECSDVTGAASLDFSSPNLTPHVGSLFVVQNHLGFYALVRIEYIADQSRGSEIDELIFSYQILRDRSDDFSKVSPFQPLAPSIALDFDVANGTLSIHNTTKEPIKWYLTATDTSGFPPPPNATYRELDAVTVAGGKWMPALNCKFEMKPMPPRSVRVNDLHMDIYISNSIDEFYRIRFVLKMTCRGKPDGEAALISVVSRLEAADLLDTEYQAS